MDTTPNHLHSQRRLDFDTTMNDTVVLPQHLEAEEEESFSQKSESESESDEEHVESVSEGSPNGIKDGILRLRTAPADLAKFQQPSGYHPGFVRSSTLLPQTPDLSWYLGKYTQYSTERKIAIARSWASAQAATLPLERTQPVRYGRRIAPSADTTTAPNTAKKARIARTEPEQDPGYVTSKCKIEIGNK